jgi:hypothetical protein
MMRVIERLVRVEHELAEAFQGSSDDVVGEMGYFS